MEYLSLPNDILIETLICLPVKSLIRFSCVSRYWFSLIKSATFITKHLKNVSREILLLKRSLPPEDGNEIQEIRECVLSFHDPDSPNLLESPNLSVPVLNNTTVNDYASLFGPCNGLVCLVDGDVIMLCNPALREFKLLCPSPFACPEGYAAFHDVSGFGFDSNTGCYKLVQLWHVRLDYDYDDDIDYIWINLYKSNTNSWNVIEAVLPRFCYFPGPDMFLNGACHWLTSDYIDGAPKMGVILSFNMSTEIFQKIEFPNWFDDEKYPCLIVLNQCIALIRYGGWYSVEPSLIDIWVMKEYGESESWTKELTMGPYLFKFPLVSWKNEWIIVETNDNQLAYCALHANKFRRFQFHAFDDSFKALVFEESLISVNQIKT